MKVRAFLGSLRPRTILVATWLFVILYAFPGYMNWDSGQQLEQARHGVYTDWHPPLMAFYWRVIEVVVRGPFGMLVLQTVLFLWGMWSLLRERLGDRAAAWWTAGLTAFPPILTPMAVVWKDAQMAAFLVAGLALAVRASWRARIAGLVLLVFAVGVRDNAAAAIPFVALWIAQRWGHERWWKAALVGFGLFVGVTGAAMAVNRALTDQRDFAWYRTVAIHDIAGTVSYEDAMSDQELRDILDGTGLISDEQIQHRMLAVYTPRAWFSLTFNDLDKIVFDQMPPKDERLARRRAWWRMVREHTHAYLSHRWAVMREVLGLSDDYVWEPVCQTYGADADLMQRVRVNASTSWLQKKLGKQFNRPWTIRWFYKAWRYALVGLILFGWAVWRRDRTVVALVGSGLLYELSYFVASAAPDWRYSHWMVICVCTAAAIVFVERLRRGRAQPAAI